MPGSVLRKHFFRMGRRPSGFKQNHRIIFTPNGSSYVLEFIGGKFTPKALEILNEIENHFPTDNTNKAQVKEQHLSLEPSLFSFPFSNFRPFINHINFTPVLPFGNTTIEHVHFSVPTLPHQKKCDSCFNDLSVSSLLNEIQSI